MCYQKRLIYRQCNHEIRLGPAATCLDKTTCGGITLKHPLCTIRLETLCPACKAKRAKVDNNLSAVAEKIRRLREELAKRGFKGDKEAGSRFRSASTTASTIGGRNEGDDHRGENSGSGAGSPTGSRNDSATDLGKQTKDENVSDTAEPPTAETSAGQPSETRKAITEESLSAQPSTPSPLTKRDDMFVGGVRLTSTTLTPVDEYRKIMCLSATRPRQECQGMLPLVLPRLLQLPPTPPASERNCSSGESVCGY